MLSQVGRLLQQQPHGRSGAVDPVFRAVALHPAAAANNQTVKGWGPTASHGGEGIGSVKNVTSGGERPQLLHVFRKRPSPAGRVDGVPEQAVARVGLPHHAGRRRGSRRFAERFEGPCKSLRRHRFAAKTKVRAAISIIFLFIYFSPSPGDDGPAVEARADVHKAALLAVLVHGDFIGRLPGFVFVCQ